MAKERSALMIVEDDRGLVSQLRWCLDEYDVCVAANREEAVVQLRRHEPGVILQDLGLPPEPAGIAEGFACMSELLRLSPGSKVVVMTGNGERANAVRAVGAGAFDYCLKPVAPDELKLIVARAFRIQALEQENALLRQAGWQSPLGSVIATEESMLKVCRLVEKIAPSDVPVLILGESGTGKELIARAVHELSGRQGQKFVAINCAAIPEQLLESELFGYERGAFTGAHRQTIGKIELANGGTLFLDEIGDMPAALQAKLLRFLQERTVERVGGREEIPVDVRVVCATNQDLASMIVEKRFRQDLYYRINGVTVLVPALRQRKGGLAALASALLRKLDGSSGKQLSESASRAIESYSWPGNVRELENKLKTALVLAESRQISPADLGVDDPGEGELPFNLGQVRDAAERGALIRALAVTGGNISRSAELLGISRPTLYDLMEKHGVRGSRD